MLIKSMKLALNVYFFESNASSTIQKYDFKHIQCFAQLDFENVNFASLMFAFS